MGAQGRMTASAACSAPPYVVGGGHTMSVVLLVVIGLVFCWIGLTDSKSLHWGDGDDGPPMSERAARIVKAFPLLLGLVLAGVGLVVFVAAFVHNANGP